MTPTAEWLATRGVLSKRSQRRKSASISPDSSVKTRSSPTCSTKRIMFSTLMNGTRARCDGADNGNILQAAGLAIEDLASHQAGDEIDHQARGAAALVEKGIELGKIERGREIVLVQKLHDEMRLAEGGAAGHGRTHARRDRWIEEID